VFLYKYPQHQLGTDILKMKGGLTWLCIFHDHSRTIAIEESSHETYNTPKRILQAFLAPLRLTCDQDHIF